MAFDIEMIRKVYAGMPAKIVAARNALGRPLTLSEKILFSHLHNDQKLIILLTHLLFHWQKNVLLHFRFELNYSTIP